MFTKKRVMLAAAILVTLLTLLVALSPALASGDIYTLTLRFRDDVQITYTIDYPSRGIWTGAEDVPIGGTQISSQVYCVDPYTPFHSRVAGLGGKTSWVWPATVDEVSGYVSGVPWAYSGAMSKEVDTVNWIVANGYRGNFLADDAESRESVVRLQKMYPDIAGSIDKSVAMMATKVAIWRALVDDHVLVVETTLDSTPNRRAAFDTLCERLVRDGNDGISVAGVQPTTFEISLKKAGGYSDVTDSVTSPDSGYRYYGPFSIEAKLQNGNSNSINAFLSAGGSDSSGIVFTDGSFARLPGGQVYGTGLQEQYVSLVDGESKNFYMMVPVISRDNGDQLTIWAKAGAEGTVLAEGTPLTYIYGTNDGQNWDAIQAFIGAANRGSRANLYAEDSVNTGDTPDTPPDNPPEETEEPLHGRIYISKTVANATALDADTEFTFQLLHADSPGATGTAVNLSEYPVYGAFSVNYKENTFTLKNGGMAYVDGLPIGSDDYYWVEEVEAKVPTGFGTPSYTIDTAAVPGSGNDNMTNAFQMVDGVGGVTFQNSRWGNVNNEPDKAFLWVGKAALDNLILGRHIPNVSFVFVLEYSEGGGTWDPVNLNKSVIDDPKKIVNGAEGTFKLTTTEAAFFELDEEYVYRVTEINPSPEYTYITYATRLYDREGQNFTSETVIPVRWNQYDTGGYFADNLNIDDNHVLRLAFGNYALNTHDIIISKQTEGNVPTDALFEFQLTLMRPDELGNLIPVAAVPLATESVPWAWAVTGDGITPERIGGEENTVLSLRSGETATILDLMEGTYIIRELSTGYQATYTINGGNSAPASGGATRPVELVGDTQVVFMNTNRVPQTGDERSAVPAIVMLVLGVGCIAGAELYRRKKWDSRHTQ